MRMRSEIVEKSFMLNMMLPLIKSTICERQQGDLNRFRELVEKGELEISG